MSISHTHNHRHLHACAHLFGHIVCDDWFSQKHIHLPTPLKCVGKCIGPSESIFCLPNVGLVMTMYQHELCIVIFPTNTLP